MVELIKEDSRQIYSNIDADEILFRFNYPTLIVSSIDALANIPAEFETESACFVLMIVTPENEQLIEVYESIESNRLLPINYLVLIDPPNRDFDGKMMMNHDTIVASFMPDGHPRFTIYCSGKQGPMRILNSK